MRSLLHISLTLVCMIFLGACAGYQLGNVPYAEMKGVEKIYIPVVHNQTYEPGIQVMVTNAIIRRFHQDGTYETGRQSEADATLEVVLTEFKRDSLRRARSNSLVTEEYRLNLHAIATLTNHRTGQKLFDQEVVIGDTSIYVNENRFQENERQAMPLAAEALAYEIVRRVTEGW
ncbi:MAG: LPS assembly lipoprotein LptE [Verrucomicrobiota bacterium]